MIYVGHQKEMTGRLYLIMCERSNNMEMAIQYTQQRDGESFLNEDLAKVIAQSHLPLQ